MEDSTRNVRWPLPVGLQSIRKHSSSNDHKFFLFPDRLQPCRKRLWYVEEQEQGQSGHLLVMGHACFQSHAFFIFTFRFHLFIKFENELIGLFWATGNEGYRMWCCHLFDHYMGVPGKKGQDFLW